LIVTSILGTSFEAVATGSSIATVTHAFMTLVSVGNYVQLKLHPPSTWLGYAVFTIIIDCDKSRHD